MLFFESITVTQAPKGDCYLIMKISGKYSLDVSLVVILLLHEAPLSGDEVLNVLTQLEHLHAAALAHLTSS